MTSMTWIVLLIAGVQLLVLVFIWSALSSLTKQVGNDNVTLRRELKKQTAALNALSGIDLELRRLRRVIGKQSKLRSMRRISGKQFSGGGFDDYHQSAPTETLPRQLEPR